MLVINVSMTAFNMGNDKWNEAGFTGFFMLYCGVFATYYWLRKEKRDAED